MRSFCFWGVMLVGISLSAGCSPPPPPPPPHLADPIGGTGNNGLRPELFHPYRNELEVFAASPLVNASTMVVTADIDSFVTHQPSESTLLLKTVGCALDRGETALDGDLAWPGNGLLTTTSKWTTRPLGQDQMRDLLTCIVTRLNPSGTTVPIWLTGANVNRDPNKGAVRPEVGHFDYIEAHWLATTDGCRMVTLVWPSGRWRALCNSPEALTAAARTRVCGTSQGAATCGVEIGEDSWCHEEEGQGIWFCDVPKYGLARHQPAIETRLQGTGWREMHPPIHVPGQESKDPIKGNEGGSCRAP